MKPSPSNKWKRRLKRLGAGLAAAGLLGAAFWAWVFPHCFAFDPAKLTEQYPAVRFLDCRGNPAHTLAGFDSRWSFPVPLAELPPHLIRYTLAVEDHGFFEHDGVDTSALFRAAWQLIRNRRIISGASTVTMQLTALLYGRDKRFTTKFIQMGLAKNLELTRSKNEILEAYFNHLPYGGRIYGAEAAARYYFGRPARDLNEAEAILLCGLPQSPARLRPDRHPAAAEKRLDTVLSLLVRHREITEAEARRIRANPLRYRDFSAPVFPAAPDPHFFQLARSRNPGRLVYTATLDPETQQLARTALENRLHTATGVDDAAAVILENSTGKVRALIGSLNFNALPAGQVNAATAPRSPGSLLKPFIYGEAAQAGRLTAQTYLDDSPLLLPDYRPENFDGSYRGAVTAQTALSDSLNTPAIRLLRAIGPERVLARLHAFGLPRPARPPGLTLALGGCEASLLQLTAAYAALANGARFRPPLFLETDSPAPARALWSPGVADLIADMLRTRPLPGAQYLRPAWKTGTSNNNRDAWCIAFTPDYTVGVWFGNKRGSASPALIGAALAAPAAGDILSALYRNAPPPLWRTAAHHTPVPLCAASGLTPTPSCGTVFTGTAIRGILLRACPRCPAQPRPAARIILPPPGAYRGDYSGKTRLLIRTIPETMHWYANGAYLGEKQSGDFITLQKGAYRLSAWSKEAGAADEINLTVE